MIATFAASFYGKSPLWLRHKIPKKNADDNHNSSIQKKQKQKQKSKTKQNSTQLNSELDSFIQGRNFATLLHRMVAELL
jgi:hypothetical protein